MIRKRYRAPHMRTFYREKMTKRLNLVLSTFLAITVLFAQSCVPSAGTKKPKWAERKNLVNKQHLQRVYDRCKGIDNGKYQLRAFGAAILSLQEGNWILDEINSQSLWISGKKCYRDYPEYCVIMEFHTDTDGRLIIKPQYIQIKLEDDVERWLTAFEQIYSKYRCYTDEALRGEMKKYGLEL